MERINKYRTSDGKEFEDRKEAIEHERKIEIAKELMKFTFDVTTVEDGIEIIKVLEKYYKLTPRKSNGTQVPINL